MDTNGIRKISFEYGMKLANSILPDAGGFLQIPDLFR
jgi:hypothetical protein